MPKIQVFTSDSHGTTLHLHPLLPGTWRAATTTTNQRPRQYHVRVSTAALESHRRHLSIDLSGQKLKDWRTLMMIMSWKVR